MTAARATRREALLALTLSTMTATTASADSHTDPAPPAELLGVLPEARLRGSGVLRFFGLRVYEARLWVREGFEPTRYAQHPFALELTYDRRLEGLAIAERSVAEMRRVGSFDEARAKRWLALMRQAFPDVVAQDRLLGHHDGAGEVSFFYNGRLTARVGDAEFARLFFGIWLAPQSSAPALRQALLGPSA
ncbi:MAG: hypothetical protein DI603_01865 [Roseateles depolymerans]|uniref:Chalcone isomerase domain-containing protein n=1 Tax=Roseateles depolymerans TaxID=76731 RepID=A0A2W5DXS8_9BURK|nr:MAG: hypothetical protein DI603_01865 [Roseateles depolymerans]